MIRPTLAASVGMAAVDPDDEYEDLATYEEVEAAKTKRTPAQADWLKRAETTIPIGVMPAHLK